MIIVIITLVVKKIKNTCTTLKTHLKFIPRSFFNKEYHIFDSTQNVDVHKLIHYVYTIIYMYMLYTEVKVSMGFINRATKSRG